VAIDDYDISVVTELESGLQSTPNEEKIALFHQPEPQQQNGNLFLEEYRLTTKGENLSRIIKCLQTLSAIAEADLQKQLVIVDDDMFTHLCKFATPVTAHIAIDNTKKIVKTGMLWYEETLPPETVFYLVLKANAVRDAQAKFDDNSIVKDSKAEAVLASITDSLLDLSVFKNLKGLDETVSPKKGSPYLQIGGNETVGMGWCKVTNYTGA
jgi:CRISPR-associated protein Cmr4